MRRIAVLTSGGDAPGMNAAVRSTVRAADAAGIETLGVHGGFHGLISGAIQPLEPGETTDILSRGGSILGTGRSPQFRTTDGRRQALTHLDLNDVEGLVVIGGDGSLHGAEALSRESHVRVVGIPATIENDLAGTDTALGFDTAVNTALESIDRIRDTAASHGRLVFVEVLGRHAGWVALSCALAAGATAVMVPERRSDIAHIHQRVQASFDRGTSFCLVVVAEGHEGGTVSEVAEAVADELGPVDYRVVALGHMQRGGAPTMRDRVLGAMLGDDAVTALSEGADRVMLGERSGQVVRTAFGQAWHGASRPPQALLDLVDRLAQ